MDSQVLLTVIAFIVYIVMAICALIPVCIVAKKSAKECNFSRGTERIISFCNCMAGGVFIAMCFLGLLPYAQDKTKKVLEDLQIMTDFPAAEFVCILGFFLIMSFEQFVIQCQNAKQDTKQVWDISPQLNETDCSSKQNYYKTVRDESASEQLLGRNPLEAVLPDSPSILKDANAPRIYQNVPMVSFTCEESDESQDLKQVPPPGPNCSHNQVEKLLKNKSGGTVRLALLYMAISIHSLFEGMALGLQTDHVKIFHLFFAVVFHEALIAFSVGITMARQQSMTLRQGVKYVLMFSLAVPLGIFLGLIVQQAPGTGGSVASAIFQSLAAGIFIHVTFLELVPAELSNSKDRMAKIAFHFLGFVAMALVTITMGAHH